MYETEEENSMQLDREAINKLLSLNDIQLRIVISRLLRENGIDPSALDIDTRNMANLRSVLKNATDEDLKRASEMLASAKNKKQ